MFRNSRLDSMKTSLNEERIFSPVATESSALDNSRAELEAKLIEKTNLVAVLSQELDL